MKKQVYVIDDYPVNRFILNEYLRGDYSVELFSDTSKCMNRMHQECPSIVLLGMGGASSGAESIDSISDSSSLDSNCWSHAICDATAIKNKFPDVRIIGTSPSTPVEMCTGVEHVFVKPVNRSDLIEYIESDSSSSGSRVGSSYSS